MDTEASTWATFTKIPACLLLSNGGGQLFTNLSLKTYLDTCRPRPATLIYATKNRSGRWKVPPTGHKKGRIQGIRTASAAGAEKLSDALGTRLNFSSLPNNDNLLAIGRIKLPCLDRSASSAPPLVTSLVVFLAYQTMTTCWQSEESRWRTSQRKKEKSRRSWKKWVSWIKISYLSIS